VAVLDLGLPDGNGADLIAELRRASPGVGVLILSASLDANNLKKATMQSVMRSGHRKFTSHEHGRLEASAKVCSPVV
jgi:DNA-binding NarL/FixJ family response regulator